MANFQADAVRVGFKVSPKVKEYYENMARETGTNMGSCMSMILKMYMDGTNAVNASKEIQKYIAEVVQEKIKKDNE